MSDLSTRMAEVSLAVAGQCITATARPASGGGDPAVGDPPAFLLMATGCTAHCALGCMQLIWLPVSMVGRSFAVAQACCTLRGAVHVAAALQKA